MIVIDNLDRRIEANIVNRPAIESVRLLMCLHVSMVRCPFDKKLHMYPPKSNLTSLAEL